MPFLPPNQQRQSTEGTMLKKTNGILRDSNTRFKAISFTVSSTTTIFSWSLQSENRLPADPFRPKLHFWH